MNKKICAGLLMSVAWFAGYLSPRIFGEDVAGKTVDEHPAIWRSTPVRLAKEGPAPADTTCDTINLNGREWGVPFYVIDHAGTQCHRVIGAPKQ